MIEKKHCQTLEFDKILKMLSHEAGSKRGRDLCLGIFPSDSLKETTRLIEQSKDAYTLLARFGSPSFSLLEDVSEALDRASSGGSLSTIELIKVASTLHNFRTLKKWKTQDKYGTKSLDNFFDALYSNKYLESKINSSIISETEIADNASNTLFELRKKIRFLQNNIKQKLDKMTKNINTTKYLQENIVTMRAGRYVIPVKSEYKANIPGLVHDASASGSTLFVEPMAVVEANNSLKELISKENAEIERILFELSQEVASFSDEILKSFNIAVSLDVIFAKANLAYKMKASVPKLNNEGRIVLKKARHPLISADKVKPVDIELGIKFDALIITGPNTGGKTVCLKTIGLFSLMAMSGLLIPAAEGSEISVFDNILTDIGDEQSIENSLSTFSSHMSNIINIINKSDEQSLVLLDELGSGTDPAEGATLAMAIIEKLLSQKSKIVCTTHYTELKTFAIQKSRVENACCEFSIKTMQPTYKLLIGTAGSSNAFAICQKLGLSQGIILKAKSMLSENNARFENALKTIEKQTQILKDKELKCDILINQNMKLKKENKAKSLALKGELSKELKKQKEIAKHIVERAIEKSNILLDELKQLLKDKKSLTPQKKSEINSKIKKLQDEFDPVSKEKEILSDKAQQNFREGDSVLIQNINTEAIILELCGKDQALVKAGSMKTRVKLENLKTLKHKEKIKTGVSISVNSNNASGEELTRLDLRGQNISESIIEIDKFIDNALLCKLNRISIIHGKGSGKLRNAVHKHLNTHSSVQNYRLGNFGEGDSGVTIVELG